MNSLVGVSYQNVSGSAVPPHGLLQMTGAPVATSAGKGYVFQATTPGSGSGPIFIDDGKGATTSGEGQYGSCFRLQEGFAWLKYSGNSGGPTDPWTVVGPVHGQFYANETGGGFLFTGTFDSTNGRILAMASNRFLYGQTTTAINTGSEASPSTFQINVWNKSGSTWPYTGAVTTNPLLLGLTCVNRYPSLTNTATGVEISVRWDEQKLEFSPVMADC